MKRIIVLLIVVPVMHWACEKPVTIKIPQKPAKLVINAWMGKDSTIALHVGKSRYSLAPLDVPGSLLESYTVKNAVPVIYEDGVAIDTLVYDAAAYNYKSLRNKKIRQGHAYMVKVNAQGFTEAVAETLVPSQSEMAGLERVKNARTNSSGDTEDEITIKLNDPAGERNFYLIQIFGAADDWNDGRVIGCVKTTDKDMETLTADTDPMEPDNCYDSDNLLMKDVNFDGGRKVLKLYVASYALEEYSSPSTGLVRRPFVKVHRITEDHFKFIKSVNIYSSTDGNPFAEPINVFSNVRNGYGIFSAYTKVVDTLR